MSNWYLCDVCARKVDDFGAGSVRCDWKDEGYLRLVEKKVMYDHGRERGHMDPYDDPLDVCPDYVKKGRP